jgi:phosphopantetheinyl transferase
VADVDVWTVALPRRDRRLAHAALREILAGYVNRPAESIQIDTTPKGKPYLPDSRIHFNLSHSRNIALIAVSTVAPVGIDVEHPREFRSPDALAQRICSERELASAITPSQLLRLWVRKEAVVKGMGDGLTRPLNEVDVLDDNLADGWQCLDVKSPAPGFHAATAIREPRKISLRSLRLHLPPSV